MKDVRQKTFTECHLLIHIWREISQFVKRRRNFGRAWICFSSLEKGREKKGAGMLRRDEEFIN
jgi:hypothetical protein